MFFPEKTPNPYAGHLPASAPLANPYVPFQDENTLTYAPDLGLVRGTLFPGLDLPFQGSVNETPLAPACGADLQSLSFAVQELALYLDTHPDDTEALAHYESYQQLARQAAQRYTAKYGPLNHSTPDEGDTYRWLDDPWPWE